MEPTPELRHLTDSKETQKKPKENESTKDKTDLGTATEGSVNERINAMEERMQDVAIKLERLASLQIAQAERDNGDGTVQPPSAIPDNGGSSGSAPVPQLPPELIEKLQIAKMAQDQQAMTQPQPQQAVTEQQPQQQNPMGGMFMQMMMKEMMGGGGSGIGSDKEKSILEKMMIEQISLGQQSIKEDISLTKSIKRKILGLSVDEILKEEKLGALHSPSEDGE